jgi:hypothetical protein
VYGVDGEVGNVGIEGVGAFVFPEVPISVMEEDGSVEMVL